VQLDAEAGLEVALDHALAVHLEECARLAKPPMSAVRTRAGSAPALDAKSSASLTASIVVATMIWLANLARLAVAVAAHERDVLAHELEERLDGVEGRLAAAHHDRERRPLAPTSPPETGASR